MAGALEELSLSQTDTESSIREPESFSPYHLPSSFGHYVIEREIACGGMGVVYEAQDKRLNRRVALKMLRQVLFATEKERLRFQREAEMVSQLDHPHIVPVIDVGKVEGQPYFTMKLIRGGNLGERLRDRRLSPRETAVLMVKIARAVHYAHQHGVLHSDLKPSNILIDEKGEPWLTDFGVAKSLNRESLLTATQSILGTPHYMAPEQGAGSQSEISTATDVWGLGVMFYEMLSGQLAFPGESSAQVLLAVAEHEPLTLSSLGFVDRDLETVCLRCLEKKPVQRLSSAGTVADELSRWLRGEPIESRPITVWERVDKWARRRPFRAVAILLFLLLFLVGASAVTWQWREARLNAETLRRTVNSAILAQVLDAREHHDFGQARRLLDSIDPERREFSWRLLNALCQGDELDLFRLGDDADPQCMALVPGTDQLAVISSNGFLHIRNGISGEEMVEPRKLPALPTEARELQRYRSLTYSPDGRRLAYANGDFLQILDAKTLTVLFEEKGRLPQFGWLDENRLLFGYNGSVTAPPFPGAFAWIVRLPDVMEVGQELERFPFPEMCAPLTVSPDRRSFALHRVDTRPWSWERSIHIYQVDQDLSVIPDAVYRLPGREYPGELTLSPKGKFLALTAGAHVKQVARVVAVESGEILFEHKFRFSLTKLSFDPSERRIGLVGDDGAVRVYDYTRGSLKSPSFNVYDENTEWGRSQSVGGHGAHSPPQDLMTRTAQDGRAQFFLGHENRIFDLLFDPAGFLVTAGDDGTIRRWDRIVRRPALGIGHLATSYDQSHPVASIDGRQVLFNIDRSPFYGDLDQSLNGSEGCSGFLVDYHAPLAFLNDGSPITQDRETTDIVVWSRDESGFREQRRLLSQCTNSMHWGQTRSGTLSRNEKRLAGSMDGWLFAADFEEGTVRWSGQMGEQATDYAGHALSPDGEWIASSDFGPQISIHRFREPGKMVTLLDGPNRGYDTVVVFSREGDRLFAGNEDGWVRVWDTSTWEEISSLAWPAHRGAVTAIAVSHEGKLIATSGDDTLKLFPVEPELGEKFRREFVSFHLDGPANWIQFARGIDGQDRALLHSVPGRRLEIWETGRENRRGDAFTETGEFLPRPLTKNTLIRLQNGRVLSVGGERNTENSLHQSLSECFVYDPVQRTWATTGSMRRPRSRDAQLELLPNQKVLAAGGAGRGGEAMADCEIYDPQSGSWQETGSLRQPRRLGNSVPLEDGKVIVIGGLDLNHRSMKSCEVFDSVTETWSSTGDLHLARAGAACARLQDGKILVVGGGWQSGASRDCELYDPETGGWVEVGALNASRSGPMLVTLSDGRVLSIGGRDGDSALASCELYDFETRTWQMTEGLPEAPFLVSNGFRLPDGHVWVSGTFLGDPGGQSAKTYLFDPNAERWIVAPKLKYPRFASPAVLLDNGKILMTGGHTPKGAWTGAEIVE